MYPLVVIKEGKIVDGATSKSAGYSYRGSKDWGGKFNNNFNSLRAN